MVFNESFSAFYLRFSLYAGPLKKDQDTLITDLRDYIVPRLQNVLVGCPLDFTTVHEMQAYLQRTDNQQRFFYSLRKREKTPKAVTTSFLNFFKPVEYAPRLIQLIRLTPERSANMPLASNNYTR